MSYSLNFKGAYIGDYIGDYSRRAEVDTSTLDSSSYGYIQPLKSLRSTTATGWGEQYST